MIIFGREKSVFRHKMIESYPFFYPSPLLMTQSLPTQVGLYKMHPDIPEQLSEKAHIFILRCFEPDPNKRATAAQLLEDPFLTEYDT